MHRRGKVSKRPVEYNSSFSSMQSSFNLADVIEGFRRYYAEAEQTRVYKLPYYEIQQWDKVLNDVALRIFYDIKFIGIPLYPVFPTSQFQYLDFANPFNRVGIEIVYKTSDKSIIDRKLELLKSQGWTIYKIESTKSYYTFDEYCDYKNVNFDELDKQEQFEFYEKSKEANDYCLLQYMKAIHFAKATEQI